MKPEIVKITSVFIALIFLSTGFMSMSADNTQASSENIKPGNIEYIDENGMFIIKNEYLENMFKCTGNPSDVDDMVGHDAMTSTPLEIATWGGGDNTSFHAREHNSESEIKTALTNVNTDSYHSIGFGAALTRNSDYVSQDPNSLWNKTGFNKQDWFCSLYYDNNSGNLMLMATNGENTSVVNIDSTVGTTPYLVSEINKISSIQSANILNYEVGDFDGDGNEEIAVFHQFKIYFFGIEKDGVSLQYLYKADTKAKQGKHSGNFATPVCMTSGDLDRDGIPELLATMVSYSYGASNNDVYTNLVIISLNKDTDNKRVSFLEASSDNVFKTTIWIPDPVRNTAQLDSMMSSVSVGDIDCDGDMEIIIGGYLWNNSMTPSDGGAQTKSEEELYLAYSEYDSSKNIKWKATTILSERNGLATTRFIPGNDSFEDYYHLERSNLSDTSLYTTDSSDDPYGLCTSPNWCNWTIPMETVSIDGFYEGCTNDQVFFDKWIYRLNGDSFTVHSKTPDLGIVMDNNNIICNNLTSGVLYNQSYTAIDGKEELYLHYAADLQSSFDGGSTEWVYVVYNEYKDGEVYANYSPYMSGGYRDLREWGSGLYNMGRCFVGNFDNDVYYAEIEGRWFGYTDPKPIAFLAGVPYEEDLSNVLGLGANSIGTTSYSKYISESQSESSTFTVDCGIFGEFEKTWHFNMEAGYSYQCDSETTITTTISKNFNSSNDSVAIWIIPMDFYVYKLYTPTSDGKYEESWDLLTNTQTPVQTIMDYEEYCTFIDNYNLQCKQFYGEDFVEVGKIKNNEHKEGDISTYKTTSNNPIISEDVYYEAGGNLATIGTCIDLSESSSDTYSHGGYGGIGLGRHIKNLFDIGGSVNGAGANSFMTGHTDGQSFTSELYQGMHKNYIGDETDVQSVLSQYDMNGTFWADLRTVTLTDGSECNYVHTGYTVNNHSVAASLATLAPDTYVPGESSPYDPTADSICMLLQHPNNTGFDAMAEMYQVELKWQGNWYPINSMSELGFEFYEQINSEWIPSDNEFLTNIDYSEDTEIWLKITGLSSVSNTEFEFRVVGEKSDGDRNPSIGVTGYKDTRLAGSHVISASQHISDGHKAYVGNMNDLPAIFISKNYLQNIVMDNLIIKTKHTDLKVGDLVSVVIYDEDGNHKILTDRTLVYADGFVHVNYKSYALNSDIIPQILVAIIGCLAIAAIGAHIIMKQ